jgi:hypothetical protein
MVVALMKATIPNTVFPVAAGSNFVKFTVGAQPYTLTIVARLYTPEELAVALTNACAALNVPLTFAFDENRVRLVVTWNGATLTFTPQKSCLAYVMDIGGLPSHVVPTGTSEFPLCIDLAGPRAYLVCCDELKLSSSDATRLSTTEHIIAAIPVSSPFGSLISFSANNPTFSETSTRALGRLTLRLIDEDMNPVDLQGSEWCVTLRFMIV